MTHRRYWVPAALLSALASLTAAGDAHAYSMSCRNRIVSTGDSTYKVKGICGDPDDARQRVETRTVRRRVSVPCAQGYCSVVVEDAVQVVIDEWTYDFGTQRFVRYLTFEQGILSKIDTGSYGYKK